MPDFRVDPNSIGRVDSAAMSGLRNNWQRYAALIATIAVLAIGVPHVDACRTADSEEALCCPPSSCAPNAGGEADSGDDHLGCCVIHHVMIASEAPSTPGADSSDHASNGLVRFDSAALPALERPPRFV